MVISYDLINIHTQMDGWMDVDINREREDFNDFRMNLKFK